MIFWKSKGRDLKKRSVVFLFPEFHLLLGHAEEGVGQGGALRLTGAEQADFPDIALFQRE